MNHYVIDTSVPATATGQNDVAERDCQFACIELIECALNSGVIYIDDDEEIFTEYRLRLQNEESGSIGMRFLTEISKKVSIREHTICLTKISEGNYAEVPSAITDSTFDSDDCKFIAVAAKAGATVYNATDTDYLHHKKLIRSCCVKLEFVCGCDEAKWFTHGRTKKVKK